MESHQIHGMADDLTDLEDPFAQHVETFIRDKGMDGTTFKKLKEAHPSTEDDTLKKILKELIDKNYIMKLNSDGLKIYVSVMWVTFAQIKNISMDDNLF